MHPRRTHPPDRFPLLRYLRAATVLITTALLGIGCASNPVTGESDFVLMSEQQELSLGKQYSQKAIAADGRYPDDALQDYVSEVGQRLARHSDRTNIDYRFTVLDSPDVNAFALPGGYIFVARGLLAYLNSEAQLAAVLGHEIGHVTARHSVRQYSAATTAGIVGAVVGSVSGVRAAGELTNTVGTALVRGYGRDMELEADRLGARYLARAGYRPDAMLEVVRILKAQESFEIARSKEAGRQPSVYHGLFSTHPDNDTRLREVIDAAAKVTSPARPRPDGRLEYLRRIRGLAFGDSSEDGVRRGNRFYHSRLGFAVSFPVGWKLENRSDRLLATSRDGAAQIQVLVRTIDRRMPPRDFMVSRLGIQDLRQGRHYRNGQLRGYTALAALPRPGYARRARLTLIYLDDRAYIFVGSVRGQSTLERYDPEFLTTSESFHRLRPSEEKLAAPRRIGLVPFDPRQGFAGLARRAAIPDHGEARLRLLNGFYPGGGPTPGTLVKILE